MGAEALQAKAQADVNKAKETEVSLQEMKIHAKEDKEAKAFQNKVEVDRLERAADRAKEVAVADQVSLEMREEKERNVKAYEADASEKRKKQKLQLSKQAAEDSKRKEIQEEEKKSKVQAVAKKLSLASKVAEGKMLRQVKEKTKLADKELEEDAALVKANV